MKTYPLRDYHPAQKFRPLSIISHQDNSIRAIFSGEKRKPKKGEWFLSGAEIEAYQAKCDLDTVYHIAKIVRVETKIVEDIKPL